MHLEMRIFNHLAATYKCHQHKPVELANQLIPKEVTFWLVPDLPLDPTLNIRRSDKERKDVADLVVRVHF